MEPTRENLVKDALYNLGLRSGTDVLYCRGMIVGITTTFMAAYPDWNFDRAFQQVVQRCPQGTRIECFPKEWRAQAARIMQACDIKFHTRED